jgi:hypothetical protein
VAIRLATFDHGFQQSNELGFSESNLIERAFNSRCLLPCSEKELGATQDRTPLSLSLREESNSIEDRAAPFALFGPSLSVANCKFRHSTRCKWIPAGFDQ